jgi:predicted DNA-binding protein (MmcQ/YjbR family)
MDFEAAKAYLLDKPEVRPDYPFGPAVLVPKIKGSMFATLSMSEGVAHMNLKCDPVHAEELRDIFPSILPGHHMNKTHWNTLILDGSIPDGEVIRLIDHSYALVVKKLKKSERTALELIHSQEELYKELL